MIDREAVTKKLNQVVYLTSDVLNQNQIKFLNEDIHAGELALAFNALCEHLYEDELPISKQTYELLEEIGLPLKFEKDHWELLKPQIIPDS